MRGYSADSRPNREHAQLKPYDAADSALRCVGCGSPNWFLADPGEAPVRSQSGRILIGAGRPTTVWCLRCSPWPRQRALALVPRRARA